MVMQRPCTFKHLAASTPSTSSDGFNDLRDFTEFFDSSSSVNNGRRHSKEVSRLKVSLSHPCLSSTASSGPTEILPFLYLGSQQDALDPIVLRKHGIRYVMNLSVNCPQPEEVKQDGHFMRIPINDSYQEKLLPHFEEAFKFLDKVCERGSVALVHCLAGISRSPTLAIAYVMRKNKWTSDRAYRYVKEKRPSISPNFNFMGQLLEYEACLREENWPITNEGDDQANKMIHSCNSISRSPDSECDRQLIKSSKPNSLKVAKSSSRGVFPFAVVGQAQCSWNSDLSEPSSRTNRNGKRVMEQTSIHRPCALDGLKPKKSLDIPKLLCEELPSPSTELQKLSFAGHSPDLISAYNPFFTELPQVIYGPYSQSSPHQLHSAENRTFSSGPTHTLTIKNSMHSNSQSSARFVRTSKLHTRLALSSHHPKKGLRLSPPKSLRSSTGYGGKSILKVKVCTMSGSGVLRSQSDNALDLSGQGHKSNVTVRPTRAASGNFKSHKETSVVTLGTGDRKLFNANKNSSSTAAFSEADRDSIGSTSNLKIAVQ